MDRFVVVVFRLIRSERGNRFRETGGGVAFIPEPRPENWQRLIGDIVARHFSNPLGPCIEVGFAVLDRSQLERHCQRDGDVYWQGGTDD